MPFDAHLVSASGEASPREGANRRAIAIWLFVVAGMIWAMVAIGGATRLTGSGLSIMEWAPLSGALPPLSDTEWQRLFDLYRAIPQYALVNQGFGLEGFQRIFWLEWLHRLWGRLIGLAYAVPLLWFWLTGRIPAGWHGRLFGLLLLGGLQGVLGWLMVASGLEPDRTAVSPYRLVLHLGLGLVLYAAVLWTALALRWPPPAPDSTDDARSRTALRRAVQATIALLILTMISGGFVAGLKAGFSYNTFPLMDGQWMPAGYAMLSPLWRNWTENVLAVQFNHRVLASVTLVAALAVGWMGWRLAAAGSLARRACLGLAAAAALQFGLGVMTLLLVVPVWAGTLHQSAAVLVLTAALVALHWLPPAPVHRRLDQRR
jgi:cytochrome c oxidase assembly protein subunit 15